MELQEGSKPELYQIMFARYYSSSLGRFMAVDPGGDTELEDPQSWNKYAYVRNNPLVAIDPDGREQTTIMDGKLYMGGCDGESGGTEAQKQGAFRTLVAVTLAFAGFVGALEGVEAPAPEAPAAPDAPADAGPSPRSLDDPASFEGASSDDIREATPGWEESPTKGEGGIRRANPDAQGEQVRHMPGNPDDPNPKKQGPYIRISKDGKVSDPIPAKPPTPAPKPEKK